MKTEQDQLELPFKPLPVPDPFTRVPIRGFQDALIQDILRAPQDYEPAITYTYTPTKRRSELRASDVPPGMDSDDCVID